MLTPLEKSPKLGPFKPTLILHGGAGSITRHNLPPELYNQYKCSLLRYLKSTHSKLQHGDTALNAACHAVSLMEDDPLFNCGRGSVFTEAGTIEMEASVMTCSINPDRPPKGAVKRGAAVSLVRGTRHPVLLAREVLLDGGDGIGGTASMHCHLSGREVEKWGWEKRGLESKGDEWFWTKKRWDEHLRGLNGPVAHDGCDEIELPSQGTVGAVCMDSWGNLAVATSTGGLTNKKVGRIGDTPTLGAGFWAEAWEKSTEKSVEVGHASGASWSERVSRAFEASLGDLIQDCLPQWWSSTYEALPNGAKSPVRVRTCQTKDEPSSVMTFRQPISGSLVQERRRCAVAMSGTGNGDSFLRTDAVRTAAAMCKFGDISLASAITAVSGPDGELQNSAGDRWKRTGEGQGGIIGIELYSESKEGNVVFDFNCGGLWRAWISTDSGEERVMVFRDEYD